MNIKEVFKIVKRKISFYERKKEIITKVHVMNFSDKENVDIMDFWE